MNFLRIFYGVNKTVLLNENELKYIRIKFNNNLKRYSK